MSDIPVVRPCAAVKTMLSWLVSIVWKTYSGTGTPGAVALKVAVIVMAPPAVTVEFAAIVRVRSGCTSTEALLLPTRTTPPPAVRIAEVAPGLCSAVREIAPVVMTTPPARPSWRSTVVATSALASPVSTCTTPPPSEESVASAVSSECTYIVIDFAPGVGAVPVPPCTLPRRCAAVVFSTRAFGLAVPTATRPPETEPPPAMALLAPTARTRMSELGELTVASAVMTAVMSAVVDTIASGAVVSTPTRPAARPPPVTVAVLVPSALTVSAVPPVSLPSNFAVVGLSICDVGWPVPTPATPAASESVVTVVALVAVAETSTAPVVWSASVP